jgi:hypothetical protein
MYPIWRVTPAANPPYGLIGMDLHSLHELGCLPFSIGN